MGAIFDSADEKRLEPLFGTDDLDCIAYREKVDNIVPDVAKQKGFFDLQIRTVSRGAFRSDKTQIGVTYFPNGPMLKGVHNITAGDTVTFPNLPYKAGAELVVAFADVTSVEVNAFAPFTAPKTVAAVPESAPKEIANATGPWILGAIALGVGLWYVRSKLP